MGFEPKTHSLEGCCSNPTELRNLFCGCKIKHFIRNNEGVGYVICVPLTEINLCRRRRNYSVFFASAVIGGIYTSNYSVFFACTVIGGIYE